MRERAVWIEDKRKLDKTEKEIVQLKRDPERKDALSKSKMERIVRELQVAYKELLSTRDQKNFDVGYDVGFADAKDGLDPPTRAGKG